MDREQSKEVLAIVLLVAVVPLLFDFSLADTNGHILIDASPIQIRRFVSYREYEAAAKESEFELLLRDMRTDVARQVLRRLAAAKPAS